MSLSERLARLRPLMTRDEITAVLGPEEAKRALDMFGSLQQKTGVSVSFSFRDECIDSVTYSAQFNFLPEVSVFGVRIGMDVPKMLAARPGTRLAEGETGQPNEYGFVRYAAPAPSPETDLAMVVKDGKIYTILLTRPDMLTVIARRKQAENERRAGMERAHRLSEQWRSVKDSDEMVLSWARHCGIGEGDDPDRFDYFARWLIATRDPEVWHMVATSWNWDNGEAPIHWIIRQKQCDIATALEIFELTDALSYRKYGANRAWVPESDREAYDLVMEIRNGLDGGFYTRSEIAYDGEQQMHYRLRRFKTDEEKAEVRLFYPRLAGRKIPGRTLQSVDTPALRECDEMLRKVL